MAGPPSSPRLADPQDRRIRRSWRLLAGSFFVLGLVTVLNLGVGRAKVLDFVLAGLVVLVGVVVVIHRGAVAALEAGRRAEAESFARILQGLSRSISPDAIVSAIVDELGSMTRADHIVVVRLTPDTTALEATLVSSRAGVPSSTTTLPLSDLEDPLPRRRSGETAGGASGASAGTIGFGESVRSVGSDGSVGSVGSAGSVGSDSGRDFVGIPIESTPVATIGLTISDGSWLGEKAPPPTDDSFAVIAGASRPLEIEPPFARLPANPGKVDRRSGDSTRIAERVAARVRAVYGLKNTIAAPLQTEAGVVGAIVLSRRTAEAWPVAAQRMLAGAALEASAALGRVYSHRAAEARASTDALTGLPNRRYFDEFCGLLARRRRADDIVGMLMIDIDHFKKLNDRHGHGVGDQVLRAVAAAIAGAVREDDVPARFGGEEFAVLLRNPSRRVAYEVGERVRAAVGSLDLSEFGVAGVSVSVGVAVADGPGTPIVDLVEQADGALYAAKRAGRDRVVAA